MEVHLDIFPAPREIEARASVIIELEKWHAGDELGSFFGVLLDFVERILILDAVVESFAEADLVAKVGPVFLTHFGYFGKGGFAGNCEIVIPDAINGEIVIIPEFAFVLGTIGGDGGVARVLRAGFAVLIKEVGKADFDKDVVLFDVFLEFVLMLNDGVFEGDTIRAKKIRIDNKVILGVGVTDGHLGVPNFFRVGGGFWCHAKSDGGN